MIPELELKEGWTTVILLLLMMLFVSWSLQAARWTEGLAVLQGVVLVGGVLGIVLAKSHTPNRLAHMLAALAGFTWVSYLTSTVLANTLGLSLQDAVVELEWLMQAWVLEVYARGASSGSYAFLLLLALLMWVMAYFSAWAVFRWQRTWWAVIVCAVALVMNVSYASANLAIYLVAFLLVALLLVVRSNVAFYEEEWRLTHVGYSPEVVWSFLRAGLVVSLVAILLAWAAPEVMASRPFRETWYRVGEPWRRLQDASWRVFQDLNYQNRPQIISLSRSTKFGGPVDLSDTPIVDIRAPNGRYWRHSVYHEYTGDGWRNTDGEIVLLDANEPVSTLTPFLMRREVTQTITLQRNIGLDGALTAAGQPVRADLPLRTVLSQIDDGVDEEGSETPAGWGGVADRSLLFPRRVLGAGETYQVVSSVSIAHEEALRQASTEYPTWVTPRYLQLPDSLPGRVVKLAETVTLTTENTYDKVVAIQDYLRDIPYNEQIEGPGEGQDGVDYFLFEAREGYCSYYASAMVVMLRAVGIPARYVEGYSDGQRVEGLYRIQELDGHSWPEVFIPEYGWIEFEPTSSEPVIDRSPLERGSGLGRADASDRDGTRLYLDDINEREQDPQGLGSGTAGVSPWRRLGNWRWFGLALVLSGLTAVGLRAVGRNRMDGLSPSERAYSQLVTWVRRLLRISPQSHQTPHEYAQVVAGITQRGGPSIELIADLYAQERFGGKVVSRDAAEAAWRQAHASLWRRWAEIRTQFFARLWPRFLPKTRL